MHLHAPQKSVLHVAWYASGHGFGHATRSVISVRALLDYGYRVTVTSTAPAFLFSDVVRDFPHSFTFRVMQVDTGVLQRDAVTVDRTGTIARLEEFLSPGGVAERFLESEPNWLRDNAVDVVCVDAPYTPLCAARAAKIPSIIVSNFTWDSILLHLADSGSVELVRKVTKMYSNASYLIRMVGHIPIPAFPEPKPPHCVDIPLVARLPRTSPAATRAELGIPLGTKILLVAFGGHDLRETLAASAVTALPDDWIALVVGPAAKGGDTREGSRFRYIADPSSYVPDLIACSDVMLGKLGYGSCSEVVALQKPFIYVPRGDFVEEAGLLRLMQQYGHAVEMPWIDFCNGRWRQYVELASCWDGVPKEPVVLGGERDLVQTLQTMVAEFSCDRK
ncbi:hypothetical protein M427DRAFT_179214 [Gonapodya prolifera JEL478]|uniref:Glycosyltransferase family 1 protein n=1 Tax=Gonapodya prolifera (strain JEL478) TaxID=1344416 RepID=A0A139AQA6_GONPJ|nr:hypothetical protein M427DRAFT_179214 [Gonapodya prolifera JEL478]|eukprot:KXS18902.1 hypothetical protein M427DRAFT_179214 [Gonapodya prolifera JEL478]